MTIPSQLFFGLGQHAFWIIGGAVLFGIGYGLFDANNRPIPCPIVSPRHRAAGYGLMNMTGVFAGALITSLPGKSTDSGCLGRDMAALAIPVFIPLILQLIILRPRVADMVSDD